jgi:galactitol-specific phosphotransferase system IIB component
MKVLVVCDEGVNRSVTLASQIKYIGHDVLTMGTNRNAQDTKIMLYKWANKIIITQSNQAPYFYNLDKDKKVILWDIGPDIYPRPYNKKLLKIVQALVQQHKEELE